MGGTAVSQTVVRWDERLSVASMIVLEVAQKWSWGSSLPRKRANRTHIVVRVIMRPNRRRNHALTQLDTFARYWVVISLQSSGMLAQFHFLHDFTEMALLMLARW